MKRGYLAVFCAFFLFVFFGDAASQHKLESWYTYWGIGYADVQYEDELDNVLEQISDAPGVDHVSVGLDLLGFYWPLGEQTIIGGILNTFGDRYEQGNAELQITGVTLSFSAMHYFTDIIGKGFFVRGDIGPSRFAIDATGFGQEQSDWGIGILLGAGFGIPVSDGTRILLNGNYAFRKVGDETVGTLGITLGGLF